MEPRPNQKPFFCPDTTSDVRTAREQMDYLLDTIRRLHRAVSVLPANIPC